MIHQNTFDKVDFNGANGLIFLGEKILVYRRDAGAPKDPLRIDLPGGRREGDESPFDTFKRETYEEFRLALQKDDIQFCCTIPSVVAPDKKSFFFVTKPLKTRMESIVFGNEGAEWFLLTPQEFMCRPDGIDRQQQRVEKYLHGTLVSL